jgi:hypothetical protein
MRADVLGWDDYPDKFIHAVAKSAVSQVVETRDAMEHG